MFQRDQRVRTSGPPINMTGDFSTAHGTVVHDDDWDHWHPSNEPYRRVRVRLDRGTYHNTSSKWWNDDYCSGPGAYFYAKDVQRLAPDDNEVDE